MLKTSFFRSSGEMVDTPVSGTGGLCRAGSTPASTTIFVFPGDIAQSGERIVRIDEVTGSIPAVSTISDP